MEERGFLEKGELVQELMEQVFENAKKESKKTSVHGLASYLAARFLDDFQFSMDVNTFTRYYKGYVLGSGKKQMPTEEVLHALCRYLGHEDFKGFEAELGDQLAQRGLQRELGRLKRRMERIVFFGGMAGLLVLGLLIFFVSRYYKKNCMIWVDDHYEKIRCSGLEHERKLDAVVLLKMREVKYPLQCAHDLWYDKSNNQIRFFSHHGQHPTNGKTLKRVTEHICEKYILERRDSVLAERHKVVLDSME